LIQILCRRYWQIEPHFLPASDGYEQQIKGRTAGLVIGDRTIGMEGKFAYSYDLGEAWTAWTGLPFVFAAWVSAKPIQPEFLRLFNQALRLGLDHLPELLKILPAIPNFDTEKYFRENISYQLDEAKWKALRYFLSLLTEEKGYQLARI
jgi:Predicted periplasmic solute-binding protein